MSTTRHPGRPIVPGYAWRLRVAFTGAATPQFPSGVAVRSQVRTRTQDATVLATLTTTDDSITRIDDDTIELVIAGATSTAWTQGHVVLDFARTDGAEPQFYGVRLRVPVITPVTRAAS